MKYSIDLQSPLAYSSFWLTLGVGLIVLALAARFFLGRLFSIYESLKHQKRGEKSVRVK